jgi:thiol-disulfide isomerase/thioredoxin
LEDLPVTPPPRLVRRFPPVARIGALVGLLAIVAVAVWALQGGIPAAPDVPRVGTAAPPIALKDLDGKDVSLAAYRSRPVLVNFWAAWCVPCRSEMPAINAVSRTNPNLVVLAVDAGDGPVPIRQFLKEVPLDFTPLLDTDYQVASRYKVNSLPTSFFIGPDGTIRAINVGPMDQRTIEMNLGKAG